MWLQPEGEGELEASAEHAQLQRAEVQWRRGRLAREVGGDGRRARREGVAQKLAAVGCAHAQQRQVAVDEREGLERVGCGGRLEARHRAAHGILSQQRAQLRRQRVGVVVIERRHELAAEGAHAAAQLSLGRVEPEPPGQQCREQRGSHDREPPRRARPVEAQQREAPVGARVVQQLEQQSEGRPQCVAHVPRHE
eukprot:2964625-Prymnesium_polylepis.1